MPDVQPPNVSFTDSSSEQTVTEYMTNLLDRLKSESTRNQLEVIEQLAQLGDSGLEALMNFLLERQEQPGGIIEGKVYQVLVTANIPKLQTVLQTHFPQGVVPLKSDRGIDYTPLQQLLAQQDFQAADRLTLEKLCELAGGLAVQRKWLYFSEVEKFPATDLQTIDALWIAHSEGRFGYSVQRELWLGVSRDWERLWEKIGWRKGNTWTRYPQEFVWDLSAPNGHLPLSNQLRGVRVINSLFTHPAWS